VEILAELWVGCSQARQKNRFERGASFGAFGARSKRDLPSLVTEAGLRCGETDRSPALMKLEDRQGSIEIGKRAPPRTAKRALALVVRDPAVA
jgi:hypothetical protein